MRTAIGSVLLAALYPLTMLLFLSHSVVGVLS